MELELGASQLHCNEHGHVAADCPEDCHWKKCTQATPHKRKDCRAGAVTAKSGAGATQAWTVVNHSVLPLVKKKQRVSFSGFWRETASSR